MKCFSKVFFLILLFVCMLSSCCKHDYRASIPAGSTMVASINFTDKDAASDLGFLTDLLKMGNPIKCGLDISQKVYLFETSDGSFGMCAKVSSILDLETYRDKLIREGLMKKGPERDDCSFAVISDKFVAGWNDNTFLVMGPVLAAGQKDMIQQIATLLNQKEDEGMIGTPLMEKLESQTGAMALVAQSTALPKQVSSVFTIGAPKDVDITQVAFAANLDIRDNMLVIESEPFSLNKAADEYIKKSYGVFRQIGDSYLKCMDNRSFMGMFFNVEGKKFLPILQQSADMQALLAGINQAIDMNVIIKSVNGDMFIGVPEFSTSKVDLSMAAMLGQSSFLDDVAYWKKSAPAGTTITDWMPNAYTFHSADVDFHFGVQNYAPLQFYAGTTKDNAKAALTTSNYPLDDAVVNTIKGKRLAVVISLSSLLPSDGGMAMLMLPSMMKVQHIVYTVK